MVDFYSKLKFNPKEWYRTCQECGHKQNCKEPDQTKELTNSYRNSKCRKCKSEALDFGTRDGDDNYAEN